MAITIRELLASDTISQAADKINFNFDQLLLNGGGPSGPNGPLGPPGPIGGRGIKGSVWYEGTANPNTTPPTLTPEDEDNYLQSNGDVWSYNESALSWVLTGINLEGPIGPPGTGGKFDEYEASPFGPSGDTTIFPEQMILSGTVANESTRSVLIGGGPAGISGFPLTGNEVVPSSIAQSLEKPSYTMMLHQFDSNDTALVFHGGDSSVGQWYEQNSIIQLSSIQLVPDDALRIVVPKALSPGNSSYPGIYIEASERALDFNAGTEIKFRTGTSGTANAYTDANNFEVSVNGGNANPSPFARIRTEYVSGEAEFRVGTTDTPALGTAYPGTIYGYGGKISLIGSDDMNLRSAGNIDIIGSGGYVNLWSTSGTLDVFASDLVNVHSKFNNVHISTDSGAGGDILIDTNTPGAEIKIETFNTNSPITLISALSDIDVTATVADINLTAGKQINATAIDITANATNSISLISLTIAALAVNDISLLSTLGDINISAIATDGDINITSGGNTSAITLKRSDSTTIVDVVAGGATSGSYLSVYGTPATTGPTMQGIRITMNGSSTSALLNPLGNTEKIIIGSNNAPFTTVEIDGELGADASTGATFDPRFDVDASIDTEHTTQLVIDVDEKIFGSGTFTVSTSNWSSLKMNWVRVGNIVTVTGKGTDSTGIASNDALPLVGPGGGSNIYGNWYNENGSIPNIGKITTQANPNRFNIIPIPGAGDNAYFTFSYRLT
tara:strand:+ start:5601 stop:7790 length:2190 start_codon:yes stop_codon:yes gene_type:complete